jgi:hypothetical protein
MMRTLVLRLRQLTLGALLVALLVPAAAATARADVGCSPPRQSFTFVVALPGPQVGTITTCELFTTVAPGISTAKGTFILSVGPQPIATGKLFAIHAGACVLASFEGTTTAPVVLAPLPPLPAGQELSGSLAFNCIPSQPGFGQTIIHFEDLGTATAGFRCSAAFLCGLITFSFIPEAQS